MKLWNSLDQVQSIQVGEYQAKLKEFVLSSLPTMYTSFENDRVGLNERQLIDVRYEDLVENPVGVCNRIYHQLDLKEFDRIEPLIQNRTLLEKEYKTNRFGSSPDEEVEIMTAWQDYATKYGYA